MLIVGCQSCGEMEILAGTPDVDGIARTSWTCPHCGRGQIVQLQVQSDARGGDLRRILQGFSLPSPEGYVKVNGFSR